MSNRHRFAVVTGASSGIGVAYAERMAERGYDLILVARRRDRLEDVAKRIVVKTSRAVEIVTADLADQSSVRSIIPNLAKEGQSMDILLTCAGIQKRQVWRRAKKKSQS